MLPIVSSRVPAVPSVRCATRDTISSLDSAPSTTHALPVRMISSSSTRYLLRYRGAQHDTWRTQSIFVQSLLVERGEAMGSLPTRRFLHYAIITHPAVPQILLVQ